MKDFMKETDNKSIIKQIEEVKNSFSKINQISFDKKEDIKFFIENGSFILKNINSVLKEDSSKIIEIKTVLDKSLSEFEKNGDSSGTNVATKLITLKEKLQEITPKEEILQNKGILNKILSLFGASPLQKYVNKFQKSKDLIKSFIDSLENDKKVLAIQNEDYKKYRNELNAILEKVRLKKEYLQKLLERIESASKQESLKKIQDQELLNLFEDLKFKVSKKIQDMLQTEALILTMLNVISVLTKNNAQLIENVDSVLSVTIPALDISVVALVGLDTQKKVLESTKEVQKTTDQILLTTSEMLKNQGTEIQKQSYEPLINVQNMNQVIANVQEAIQNVKKYKKEALPIIKENIEKIEEQISSIEIKEI